MLSSPEHKSYYNTALSKMQVFFTKIFNFFQQKSPHFYAGILYLPYAVFISNQGFRRQELL